MLTKINEVVAAFRETSFPDPTMQEQIDAHGEELQRRFEEAHNKPAAKVIRGGVFLVAVIPTSMLIAAMLARLKLPVATYGAIGILLGGMVGWLMGSLHEELLRKIPFHKLNPFFGNKIDETIATLRGKNA